MAIVDFLYFGEANIYEYNLDGIRGVQSKNQLQRLPGPKTSARRHTSMEATESNPSRLPEDTIKTNGVSYVTDCIAPARVEPSA